MASKMEGSGASAGGNNYGDEGRRRWDSKKPAGAGLAFRHYMTNSDNRISTLTWFQLLLRTLAESSRACGWRQNVRCGLWLRRACC